MYTNCIELHSVKGYRLLCPAVAELVKHSFLVSTLGTIQSLGVSLIKTLNP